MTVVNGSSGRLILIGLLIAVGVSTEAQTSTAAETTRAYYEKGKVAGKPGKKVDVTIKIATGQKTGTYFPVGQALGTALGKALSKNDDRCICVEVVETAGSEDNLAGVKKADYDFGIVQSDVLDYRHGRQRYGEFKVIGAVYREPVYVLVRKKLHLSSIEQLRQKKIAVGEINSGIKFTSEVILGMFGMSLDDLEPRYYEYGQIRDAFRKESIDAAFLVIARIPKSILGLINEEVYVLKMDRSDLTKIASAHPNRYRLLDVADPTYDVNHPGAGKKKFRTLSVTSVLVTNSDTDPDVVRNCTEQLHKLTKTKENQATDPNLAGLQWVRYPFLLYGKKRNDLLHPEALGYYEDEHLIIKCGLGFAFGLWFPALLFALLASSAAGLARYRRRWLRNHIPGVCVTYIFLFIITLLYTGLYCFESNVGNPDVTGSPVDLLAILPLVSKFGDVSCITEPGRIVRFMALCASAFITLGMMGKIGLDYLQKRIKEALTMIPGKNQGHVVICNWAPKIENIIEVLRSDVVGEKRRIIIIDQTATQHQSEISKYPDVYILPGDPTKGETLTDKRLNISDAHAIVILADEEHPDESDVRSQKILGFVKYLLKKNIREKPKVIVEQPRPDPTMKKLMQEQGADEVISYPDIKDRLLAQAIITPAAISFVNEILTAEKESNEVYELKIAADVHREIVEDCRKAGRKTAFQHYASEIARRYRSKHKYPVTVIGVKSEGKVHINPKDDEFSQCCENGKIDAAVVLAWRAPNELKK